MSDFKPLNLDEKALTQIAEHWGQAWQVDKSPCVVFLQGDLGAGKTTFVRAFLRGLGFNDSVKSPTYTLLNAYEFKDKVVYHADLYRITDPHEVLSIIDIQSLAPNSILWIEWPEKGQGFLPNPDLELLFETTGESRLLSVKPLTDRACQLVGSL